MPNWLAHYMHRYSYRNHLPGAKLWLRYNPELRSYPHLFAESNLVNKLSSYAECHSVVEPNLGAESDSVNIWGS